jgi:hypothetical protein
MDSVITVPQLSLCIATMDRWDFLKVNLPQYLTNPYISEIVISDENGQDAEKIRATFNDPKIHISVNDKRLGGFHNKYKAVSLASNPFVCLMDSDNFAPISYFEAWAKWLNGKQPDEYTIYSPSRTTPQPNHEGFDYRNFNNITLSKDNFRYYWHMGSCLYNTGNYIVSKKMYLTTEIDTEYKETDPLAFDVLFKNYFMWKNNNMKMIMIPDMEYNHIVHPGSYYLQEDKANTLNRNLPDNLYM